MTLKDGDIGGYFSDAINSILKKNNLDTGAGAASQLGKLIKKDEPQAADVSSAAAAAAVPNTELILGYPKDRFLIFVAVGAVATVYLLTRE